MNPDFTLKKRSSKKGLKSIDCSTYIDMELPVCVNDTPGKHVEVERSPNVLALQTAPLESGHADLERQETPNCLAISCVLVPIAVELVRLVIQGHLTATELCVESHEVARGN